MKKLISRALTVLCLLATSVSAKTIEVEHALGKSTVPVNPQRVIVLGMDTLDILEELNIEPIGVVKAPMPDYLSKFQEDKYAAVGSLFEPDYETIFNLKPDLIIASNRTSPVYKELQKIAPTVVFMADSLDFWNTTQKGWRMIGKIFSKQDEVEAEIAKVQTRLDSIKHLAQSTNAKALTVMTSGGNLTVFGEKSRYSAIYRELGFTDASKGSTVTRHGNAISFEYISDVNPDYLLVLDRDKAIGIGKDNNAADFDNDLINNTNAFKNKKISFLTTPAWYISASGIRATHIMLDDVAKVLN